MATTDSKDSLDHPFIRVRDLSLKLLQRRTLYVDNDDLVEYGIEVTAMDIETGAPTDSGPQFCDLYPQKEFDAIFKMVGGWPRRRGTGVYWAAREMGMLIEDTLLDGGLAPKSKYIWRR